MLNEALRYVKKGFFILPLNTIIKGKCSCGNDKCPEKNWGKHPCTENGLKDATKDEVIIKEWWGKWPEANIGILLEKSGYCALDIDPRNGGDITLSNLLKVYGDFPATVEAITGSKGSHFLFKYHKDFDLPDGFHHAGIDIRKNAYIVVPPSIHKSGNVYEWVCDQSPFEIDVADVPKFLINPKKEVSDILCDGTALEDLKRLSGKEEVRNEVYTFKKNRNNTIQILVNGEETSAWIDGKGYIGSHSRGGPTIIQWLEWFDHTKDEAIAIAKKYLGDLVKKEITLKIAHDYFKKYNDTIWISELDRFYMYENGVYEYKNEKEIELVLLNRVPFVQTLKNSQRKQIIENIKMLIQIKLDEINPPNMLNLRNGIYDLNINAFFPHAPEHLFTIQLPYSYNKDALCPKWISTLNEIFMNDQNKNKTIQEFFGYSLTRSTDHEKALFLLGEGATGKSTVFTMQQNLVGSENYSTLSLKSFGNPVLLASIVNKMINVSGEMPKKAEDFEAEFRTIVTGEPITINEKFIPAYSIKPYCKLIFSANELPYIDDKSSGFYRRLLVVPFERVFKEETQNKKLKSEELPKELPGVFNWALIGLKRLNERGFFVVDKYMENSIKEIKKSNNPIEEWAEERIEIAKEGESKCGTYKSDVYEDYKIWCKKNGYNPCGHNKFSTLFYNIFKPVTLKDVKSVDEDGRKRYWPNVRTISGDGGVLEINMNKKKEEQLGWGEENDQGNSDKI